MRTLAELASAAEGVVKIKTQRKSRNTSNSARLFFIVAGFSSLIILLQFLYSTENEESEETECPEEQMFSSFTFTPTKFLEGVVRWIDEQGSMGPVYYVFFLAAWIILMLPCSVAEIVPGFLFGFKIGWMVSVLGKSLGISICLILGRCFFKNTIDRLVVQRYPTVKAFNKAVEEEGFLVFVFIRATFLPMLIKNYGLGVLDVPIWKPVVGSIVAGIPFAAMWATVGASSSNLAEIIQGNMTLSELLPEENKERYILSLVIIVASVVYVFYKLGKRFRKILIEIDLKSN